MLWGIHFFYWKIFSRVWTIVQGLKEAVNDYKIPKGLFTCSPLLDDVAKLSNPLVKKYHWVNSECCTNSPLIGLRVPQRSSFEQTSTLLHRVNFLLEITWLLIKDAIYYHGRREIFSQRCSGFSMWVKVFFGDTTFFLQVNLLILKCTFNLTYLFYIFRWYIVSLCSFSSIPFVAI